MDSAEDTAEEAQVTFYEQLFSGSAKVDMLLMAMLKKAKYSKEYSASVFVMPQ